MIGDGPERVHAEQQCRDLGICDDIRFLGKLARAATAESTPPEMPTITRCLRATGAF